MKKYKAPAIPTATSTGSADSGGREVDSYIASFPERTRKLLEELRRTIRKAAPEATERISYRMPTFHQDGNLIHFAAFEHHIGLYPTPSGIVAFERDLSRYKRGKGSVQFPLDEPLPLELVERIVAFRLAERLARKNAKTPPRNVPI